MGSPQVKSSGLRPCLICRRSGRNSFQMNRTTRSSCPTSLCTIFGLPGDHPFKTIYERSLYCDVCFKELQEADVVLGRLELLRQSLLRFQTKIYSRLGDNYFQIKDLDSMDFSYVDFEKGGDGLTARKFNYDDIVKIVYEKMDQESYLWERFTSEGRPVSALVSHSSTQTGGGDDDDDWSTSPLPPIDTNDMDDAEMSADCDLGANNDHQDDLSGVHDPLVVTPSPLPRIPSGNNRQQVTFSKAPINFDESEKRYCTYDPENCKRYFYDEYNLQVHLKSVHLGSDKPHECNLCWKGFVDEARLKAHHIRVHLPVKVLVSICEHCGKELSNQSHLRRHIRRKHSKPTVHTCKLCTATFRTLKDLQEHEGLHRSMASPFACVFCPEVLSHSAALKAHSKGHFPDLHHCNTCRKSFANENSLKHHLKTHDSSAKVHKCDQCSFSNPTLSGLKAHMMSHSNEKPFTCEQCGASYKFFKNLNAHMRAHSEEKPYSCQICNASFRERSYLKRHEESHSVHPNYSCNVCLKEFKVRERLRKHKKIHREGYVKPKPRTRKSPATLSSTTKTRRSRKMKIKKDEIADNSSLNKPPPTASTSKPRSVVRSSKRTKTETKSSRTQKVGRKQQRSSIPSSGEEEVSYDNHNQYNNGAMAVIKTTEEEISRTVDSIMVQQSVIGHTVSNNHPRPLSDHPHNTPVQMDITFTPRELQHQFGQVYVLPPS